MRYPDPKYRLGATPITRLNIVANAQALSYPKPKARVVIDSPFARRGSAAKMHACRHQTAER
jgi:hypothetical protein